MPLAIQKEAVIRKREVTIGEEENEARIAQMKDWQRYAIMYTVIYNMNFNIMDTIKYTIMYDMKMTSRNSSGTP